MSQTQLQNIDQLESALWDAADNLRANSKLTAGEYCMPVLGVIFLRHATNRYNDALPAIQADQAAGKMPKRPLTAADFKKRRALMLPKEARYDELLKLPKGADLGTALVKAMEAIERDFDMSTIDLEKLRDEFVKKVKRKASAVEDIRQVVEKKLAQMLARNPQRMDYHKKYSEIIADYNRDKDRVSIEDTFARLVDFVKGLDAEDHRAAEEGLSEGEYALFCLLQKDNLAKTERERVKRASQGLLDALQKLIAQRERWTEKEETKAEVEVLILNELFTVLPTPPFTEDEKSAIAQRAYQHIWQKSA